MSEQRPVRSHTATDQWKSFEVRMRHRRAERCLLRASMALEAGRRDEAREALEEVRRLAPDTLGLGPLEARMLVADTQPAAGTSRKRRVLFAAAAAVLLLSVGTGGVFWWASPSEKSSEDGKAIIAAAPVEALSPTVDPPRAVGIREELVTARVFGVDTVPPPSPRPAEPPAPAPTEPRSATRPERVPPPTVARALPTREPESTTARAVHTREPEPAAPSVADPAARTAPPRAEVTPPAPPRTETAVPAARPTTSSPSSSPRPADTRDSKADEVAGVRAILSRYEAAYSGLDAAAARAVWPAVDERALARAFDGLQSQRVSLQDCDVSITGASARAECAGSASWVPKVGGSGRTEARRWRFDLRNSSGSWQIVRAEAR